MTLTNEEKQRRLEERRKKKWKETHKLINNIDNKLCNTCEEWLPSNTDYFYENKANGLDGLHSYCKECAKKRYYKWIENNRDRKRKNDREWAKRPENVPKVRKNQKLFIERGKRAEWIENNKERMSGYGYYKRMHGTHNISNEEWIRCREYFNNCCAYCGMSESGAKEKFNQQLHKEHVDHNGANDLSNCVPACKSCNSRKWEYELNEWYSESNPVFDKDRLSLIHKWIEEDYKEFIQVN